MLRRIANLLNLNDPAVQTDGFSVSDADKISIGILCGDDSMKRKILLAMLKGYYVRGRIAKANEFLRAANPTNH